MQLGKLWKLAGHVQNFQASIELLRACMFPPSLKKSARRCLCVAWCTMAFLIDWNAVT